MVILSYDCYSHDGLEFKIALMGTGKCNPDEGDSGGEHKHD